MANENSKNKNKNKKDSNKESNRTGLQSQEELSLAKLTTVHAFQSTIAEDKNKQEMKGNQKPSPLSLIIALYNSSENPLVIANVDSIPLRRQLRLLKPGHLGTCKDRELRANCLHSNKSTIKTIVM